MRLLLLALTFLSILPVNSQAQTGKKALKEAKKAITKYSTNVVENKDQLVEGLALLEKAFQSDEVKNVDGYLEQGTLFNLILDSEYKSSLLGLGEMISFEAAQKASISFEKAIGLADKSKYISKANKGLLSTEAHLNNVGVYYFEKGEYSKAYDFFNRAIEVYELISTNGGETRLNDEIVRNDHYFATAASAYYGQRMLEAKSILYKLKAMDTDKPLVYEALFRIAQEEGNADALTILEEGREKFPDDTGLLFSEINYYLQQGKLEVLIAKLELALEKEPNNISIYNTLGNVYDQLNQKEREANNIEKANEYFDLALKYYNTAVDKDSNNFDAVYSQGALYYNKAAAMTKLINEVSNDFSAAGTKKYNALKAEMDGYFQEALPYFIKAEQMNGNDLNTLIALKEIYARIEQLDKVGSLKERIEKIQATNSN